jgi:hypothetical protein
MKEDPFVKEVREAGKKLFRESGGTLDSFVEMLKREEAKSGHPIFRRDSAHSGKGPKRRNDN